MSQYGMRNFPYEKALDYFLTTKDRRGVTAWPSVAKRLWGVAFNEDVLDDETMDDETMETMDDENEALGFISIRPNGLSLVPCAHPL